MPTTATRPDPMALMQTDREQLTLLLRGLAARLDELDRSLADLAWHRHGPRVGAALGEMYCERSSLEAEGQRLTHRLGALALRLNELDIRLSGTVDHVVSTSAQVGTCPYCGYPSLGSGLCAYCRPQLAP